MSRTRCPVGEMWDEEINNCIDRITKLRQIQKKDFVAVEMARRKKVFHNKEKWDDIHLWGLFDYKNIKQYLNDGKLINNLNYRPENVTYWVVPSKEYWEKSIKPIVNKFTKKELQETF